MKVREIMTSRPHVCSPSDRLSEVAAAMWDNDCGVLPVVDDEGRAVGMITDRDICMATTFRGASPTELHVSDIGYRTPYSCHPDDPVSEAMGIMQDAQIHRIPVVDDDNRVQGIVSANDVILEATARKGKEGIGYADVVSMMKGISAHRNYPATVPHEEMESAPAA